MGKHPSPSLPPLLRRAERVVIPQRGVLSGSNRRGQTRGSQLNAPLYAYGRVFFGGRFQCGTRNADYGVRRTKEENLKMKNGEENGKHLSPAQWLPKPATSQMPQKRRALRATWSPRLRRAERGMILRRIVLGGSNRRRQTRGSHLNAPLYAYGRVFFGGLKLKREKLRMKNGNESAMEHFAGSVVVWRHLAGPEAGAPGWLAWLGELLARTSLNSAKHP